MTQLSCKHLPTRSGNAGVTLIEMMVVLVMISVVAAIIVPNVISRPDEARASVAQTDLRSIASALELYRLDNQTYPTTTQGLAALVEAPISPPLPRNWAQGGYLTSLPQDPWGNAYVYQSPGTVGGFDLMSLGSDGAAGGDGPASDIALGDRQAAGLSQ
ncbi:type II secretion system major pseudopilin GspG [uncultured Roseobacter sp.]|uniref:type II secretion system major pseudopilin GspG n=1 Tax=uncultured Roseobacter sp. TaxID=114847 RepID=UPI00261FD439|nr:type II secretion system major pseudopilin GspG [uncultured Roseobacter sp.]